MKLVKDFEEFIELLSKNEVKYLVVGGYAFAVHAYPRFTNDIDFFVLSTKPNIDKIISVLKEFGFDNSSISAEDLLQKDKVVQLGELPYRIDLLTSIDGVDFEDAWERKIQSKYGEQAIYFISKEDLIKNKKASGRKKIWMILMNSSHSPVPDKLTYLENKKVKDILVVRQHNHIGDILCSLTLYAALKQKYPDSKITLAAAKTSYEIPFAELNSFLDRVIIFDKKNLSTIINFFFSLRERKYQLGIVPSTIKVSRTSHFLNFLSGAKIRVGVKSIDSIENKSYKLLNVKSDFNWNNTHQLERNLDVVKQIGCDLTEEEKMSIRFKFSDEEISAAKIFIEESFTDKTRKIIGFHPGAGKKDNMWQTNRFIELIKKIYDQHDNYVLLTSGKVDKTVMVEVENEMKKSGIHYKILNDLAIKKLGAILSLIDLYITNDTGSMHIAGFSDARMISLFGPTNPNEWAPQGINKHFIKSRTGNINDISVDEVFNLSKRILEE